MKRWIRRIAAFIGILGILVGLLMFYSFYIGARGFAVDAQTVAIPNWSPTLNGFRVVAISDIHSGSNYAPEERLRYMVEQANAQNADILVLLGDYVSESKLDRSRLNLPEGADGSELRMPVATFAAIFGGLRAKHGVFAVIGNHDNWHNEKKITAELERVGIRVLENEIESIQIGDETVRLWGIEDYWKNRRVPLEPFDGLVDKRNVIAITHNPDSLLKTPDGISIMFAGHSHGGQVNLPFYGPIPFVNDERFMDGLAVVDGKHAYITSGVGTSVISFRFRVPPEIAVITLNAK